MTDVKKDWSKEQKRVDLVVEEINQKIEASMVDVHNLKSEVLGIRKNFWQDVTVNLDEPDDVIETYVSIKQQSELLAERERGFGLVNSRVKTLNRLKQTPYFGRIDLQEEDESEATPIYIGMASFLNQEEDDFLVYDWRAPISSVYYDYSPGHVSYNTPSGAITGEMDLKRQFIIKNGKIEGLFDTGVTIGDELLQKVLGNQADSQMKSIVATIQKEQNRIIRNESSRILVVQGVAGSGKTSAALQRIAYLLYRYRETLKADNIVLFSPNPLFNSYVASVLPELGEDNMQQTTFQEFIEARLGRVFQIEDPFMQLEYVLTAMDETDYETRIESINYKASLKFKKLIDDYVATLGKTGLIFKDITFRNKILITSEQIAKQFYSLDSSISIPNRMKFVEEWLLQEVKRLSRLERKKPWVEDKIQLLDKEDYLEVYKRTQKEDHFNDIEREQQLLEKLVINREFKPVYKQVKQLKFLNIKGMYQQLFEQTTHDMTLLPKNWEEVCRFTLQKIGQGVLPYEDTTPYVYMQDQIEGRKSNTLIRHVFIDEAQDYSAFQYAFMRQLFPNSKMTILGDINQAIHSHATNTSSLYSPEIAEGVKQESIVLTKSYRSTRQIVEFTRQMIAGGEQVIPFNRDGNKPQITQIDTETNLKEQIIRRIRELQDDGQKSIAIICKTAKESKKVYNALSAHLDKLRLINKESTTYENGLLVIPAYLAKGVEFDAVIIYNASNKTYARESERKLFYTACTRAMHELHLFSAGAPSQFLSNVKPNTYKMYNMDVHLNN